VLFHHGAWLSWIDRAVVGWLPTQHTPLVGVAWTSLTLTFTGPD